MEIEEENEDKKIIEGNYSQEFYIEKQDLSKFLKELAEEIAEGNELKISTDNWELPFKFKDKIELEIEKEHDELEIEMEFKETEETEELSIE